MDRHDPWYYRLDFTTVPVYKPKPPIEPPVEPPIKPPEPENPPVAGFTSNVVSGAYPLTVRFTDSSTDAVSWYWNFGDGNTSTQKNPVHVYTTDGSYTVSLVVTNIKGTDTITKDNLITITIPIPLVYHTVTSTIVPSLNSQPNGSIVPLGSIQVVDGGSVAYLITPNPGFEIAYFQVDGVDKTVTA
jgi:PKD repeat protein